MKPEGTFSFLRNVSGSNGSATPGGGRKAKVLIGMGLALFCVAPATAEGFCTDFSRPPIAGLQCIGGSRPDGRGPYPTFEDGHLVLTDALGEELGTVVLDDLDPGRAVTGFTVSCRVLIGDGSEPPADGLAFHFGPDVDDQSRFGEDGPGGARGITIALDAYDNGGDEPSIEVRVDGATVFSVPADVSYFCNGEFTRVRIHLSSERQLTLNWGDTVVLEGLALDSYRPAAGARFAWGARTSALFEKHWLDDLSIVTQPGPALSLAGLWPEYLQGPVIDVQTREAYAYALVEPSQLFVLDVRDPSRPVLVDRVALNQPAAGSSSSVPLRFDVDCAYVADRQAGLKILDAGDPPHPSLLSKYVSDTAVNVVEVDGGYAYLGLGLSGGCPCVRGRLDVVDVRDPARPEYVTTLAVTNSVCGVAVAGDTLYFTADGGGLVVADIVNRARAWRSGWLAIGLMLRRVKRVWASSGTARLPSRNSPGWEVGRCLAGEPSICRWWVRRHIWQTGAMAWR